MDEKFDDEAMTEEAKKVKDTLALVVRVSEKGVKSPLLDVMQATVEVERDLLACALDQGKMAASFPEGILRENYLIDGMPRLRHENGQHWSWIINGRADNEMDEIYNYLRLVRIPKMAFRILEAINSESTMVLKALTDKQYEMYNDFGDLARKVLQTALDTLGVEKAASLMKIDLCALQNSLKKLEI